MEENMFIHLQKYHLFHFTQGFCLNKALQTHELYFYNLISIKFRA